MGEVRAMQSYPPCPTCETNIWVIGKKGRGPDYESLDCERLFDAGGGR